MNARHIDMDDMAEFGEELYGGRVGKLTGAELNRAAPMNWPPRRIDVQPLKSSCGGRFEGQPEPAECGTAEGADDGKPAYPGLSWDEFRKSCVVPVLGFLACVAVYSVVRAVAFVLGPQQ